jgi:hypothetical protein
MNGHDKRAASTDEAFPFQNSTFDTTKELESVGDTTILLRPVQY